MALMDSGRVLAAMGRSQAIIEFNPGGTILSANANFCRALGYEASEIVGQHHRMFVDPAFAQSPDYAAFWRKLGAGEFVAEEFRRVGKGGREVWIQGSYNPVTTSRGKVYKVVKFATDVTAAKLLSAENAGKLNAISRAQATIEFTTDGQILTANPNFLSALGYRLEEVAGQHHRMFVDPAYASSPAYADLWARLRAGEFVAEEFKRIGKGGREVWIQASYNPIFDMSGRVMKVVKYATDVTPRVHAVQSIASALSLLADGDLVHRIDEPFIPALDEIRRNFNMSSERLQSAMRTIGENASGIDTGADQIRIAADDLAQRTEQQASALEETSAALDEMTVAVRSSSQRAENAGTLVKRTTTGAEKSGQIVERAIAAMAEIEQSSDKIGKIIGVIDEIAFQTNLLALNAGVEAARAGEAGRGFAVVAQEVRGLAQRSAEAAKEIKELISTSSAQVGQGVDLVGQTGLALKAIVAEVSEINEHVASIVASARSQATGLGEINIAIGTLNQGTQQNAAMVEESTAASNELAREVGNLNDQIGKFRTADDRGGRAASGDAGASIHGLNSRIASAYPQAARR